MFKSHTFPYTISPPLTTQCARVSAILTQISGNAHLLSVFIMETEKDGMLPFLGKELLNQAPQIETKLYVKPTNTGLLLHYNSHVEQTPLRYKRIRSLLTTMLDSEYRLSSTWFYHLKECECLKSLFSRLKYAQLLINSTSNTFVSSRVADSQPSQASAEMTSCDVTRVV